MRLKPYVTLYAIKGGQFFSSPEEFAAQLGNLQSKFILIGTAEKLKEVQERTNGQYRALNADPIKGTFGAPVETYPGLVSYHLELDIVVLHDQNMLEAFGYVGSDLAEQRVPLIVQLVKPVPLDPATNQPISLRTQSGQAIEAEVKTYWGGWFDNNSVEFDVNASDLKLIQSANMIVAGGVSSKTTL
jgi:hypothetical protein